MEAEIAKGFDGFSHIVFYAPSTSSRCSIGCTGRILEGPENAFKHTNAFEHTVNSDIRGALGGDPLTTWLAVDL